ncbi:class I SAM-dependent methyltransferase [Nonomuraea sp. NPDC001831]|uniref:class I SAM-dependent methyltransferase n=1 Tax=Nonomuraea sp. NPDC001831 TaxID=3364340 RepID=UPI0036883B2C
MRASYLPSLTLDEYLRLVATVHPQLHAVLDFERPGAARALGVLAATSSEFDSDRDGRGDSYRRAQQDALVRWTGIRALLGLLAPDPAAGPPLLLDVLGGDGTVARAAAGRLGSLDAKPAIITGDLSGQMVDRALAQGLPAVRQAAQFLFLREGSVGGVLLAYGTHHIPPADRPGAVAEAARVTRPGGRIVLHDFDDSGPMAGFFARVVHPHAAGGHAYRHFTRPGLAALFADAGLPVRVLDLYDPLIVRAGSEQAAKERMCRYVADMYGLGAYFAALADVEAAWRVLERHFDHGTRRPPEPAAPPRPVVYRRDGQYVAEVPRTALIALSTRPAGRLPA